MYNGAERRGTERNSDENRDAYQTLFSLPDSDWRRDGSVFICDVASGRRSMGELSDCRSSRARRTASPISGDRRQTQDGRPDFSGVWQPDDQKFFQNLAAGLKPEDVPMQAWAKELQQLRVTRDHVDDPLARCLPPGVPRVNTNGLFPFKIIQTPSLSVIFYEQLYLFRQIFMDGRKLGNDAPAAWLGYSTARWDGDTL